MSNPPTLSLCVAGKAERARDPRDERQGLYTHLDEPSDDEDHRTEPSLVAPYGQGLCCSLGIAVACSPAEVDAHPVARRFEAFEDGLLGLRVGDPPAIVRGVEVPLYGKVQGRQGGYDVVDGVEVGVE